MKIKLPQRYLDVKIKLPEGNLGTVVKLPQHKIARILSAILAVVVLGSFIWVLNTDKVLSQTCRIPKPQLNSEIPVNPSRTASNCEDVNIGDFAWRTFVALNSPLEGNIGDASKTPRNWELYQFPEQVFKADGTETNPLSHTLRFTEFGSKFDSKSNSGFAQLALNLIQQGGGDGLEELSTLLLGLQPLVDRWGNYILNEVRMNPVEVKQIVTKGWDSAEGLMPFANFCKSFQLMCSDRSPGGTYPAPNGNGEICSNNVPCSVEEGNDSEGTIEIKAAWMVLPDTDTYVPPELETSFLPDVTKYYTTTRLLSVETPDIKEGSKSKVVEVPVALVGFHILQKTSQQGWIWSTFEHTDNAPDDDSLPATKHYNLYDPDCTVDCTVNTPMATEPYLWQLDFPHAATEKNGIVEAQTPSQITRLVPVQKGAKLLNDEWQRALPSFWKNYRLIGVQWLRNPYIPYNVVLRGVLPENENLANVTLEPYVQKEASGNSCIACHTLAKLPLPGPVSFPADFSFLMRHAKDSLP
ncbi:MAG: hypothetical protein SXA11_19455 [Cyanobacteriota bacterium]|nr:hypothetical protein [Cyanobacteriota bacterium]